MKSFATIVFASGALASLAPPAYYPAPAEHTPVVYPTGAVPSKAPHESAPYPYPTEKKETVTYKSVDKHSTTESTDSVTKVYVTKTYEHETTKPTDETKTIVYTYGAKTYTETEKKVIVVPTYPAGHEQDVTKTAVIVPSPTPYKENNGDKNDNTNDNTDKHANMDNKDNTVTETVNVYVTAPAVCVPAAEQTVTVTSSLTITVPATKPTGYVKPTGYGNGSPSANKTITVSPIQYAPTTSAPAAGSYAPANPSYAPAANGTTEMAVKPTYSAPAAYTGGAMKTGAGFGAFALAVVALVL